LLLTARTRASWYRARDLATMAKRIYFDATLGDSDHTRSRIEAIYLENGHPAVADLGQGNCPSPSPTGDQVIFPIR
jgi:hypothetical protein